MSVVFVFVVGLCLGYGQTPIQSTAVSSVPSWFTHCAGEGGQCVYNGPAQVIFGTASGTSPLGVNGHFLTQTVSDGVTCSGAIFGDPAPGQPKACWVGPLPDLGRGTIAELGGSNYTFYVQNNGSWDDDQRVSVGLYHLAPTLVEAQLRQIFKSGQKKVSLFIWYLPFDNPLSPSNGIPVIWPDVWGAYVNSSGGQLSTQAQSNLKAILGLIQSIGFDQVTLRFAPIGAADPISWGNTWKEASFQEDEQFVFNTRQLMESALAASSIRRLYDLGVEQAGIPHNLNPDGITYSDGQTAQWTKRLWADYGHAYGVSDSYGFSIAYSYGRLSTAIAEYDAAGFRPNTYGLDIYNTGQVWNVYQELLGAGEPGKPVIVQETQYNDSGMLQDFETALQHIPLTISWIEQWPGNSNTPNADGMSPPTNYGNYGGATVPSGTLVGFPCTIPDGQSTCTTSVSWSTSNSSRALVSVNGAPVANLPNIKSTLTGSTTLTLSLTPTFVILKQLPLVRDGSISSQGPALLQPTTTELTLTAIVDSPPKLFSATATGSAISASGSGISSVCSVNLYDPSGTTSVPVTTVTNVTCQSSGIAFVLPPIVKTYAALSLRVVNANGLSSGIVSVALQQVPVLTLAGLGGTSIWAIGAGISSGCTVNLFDPTGSTVVPIANVSHVNCEPNSLSFAVPQAIMSNYRAISFSVIDANGMSSDELTVTLSSLPIATLLSAELESSSKQMIWATGAGTPSSCSLNFSNLSSIASTPIANVDDVDTASSTLFIDLPNALVNKSAAMSFCLVGSVGIASNHPTTSLPSTQGGVFFEKGSGVKSTHLTQTKRSGL